MDPKLLYNSGRPPWNSYKIHIDTDGYEATQICTKHSFWASFHYLAKARGLSVKRNRAHEDSERKGSGGVYTYELYNGAGERVGYILEDRQHGAT